MLWVYSHYTYFTLSVQGVNSLSTGIDIRRQNLTFRRQILTSKIDPRTERVNHAMFMDIELKINAIMYICISSGASLAITHILFERA